MSKELFKEFARKHPELANNVMKGDVSWQKLYELYDIYGEDSTVWNNYFTSNIANVSSEEKTPTTFKEFFNTFKNMDMDSVQKGINNLQKTIGLLQDLGVASLGGSKVVGNNNSYQPRPLYRHFED